jgi:hypothetical protein
LHQGFLLLENGKEALGKAWMSLSEIRKASFALDLDVYQNSWFDWALVPQTRIMAIGFATPAILPQWKHVLLNKQREACFCAQHWQDSRDSSRKLEIALPNIVSRSY